MIKFIILLVINIKINNIKTRNIKDSNIKICNKDNNLCKYKYSCFN